jgi:hypothetical protein
VTITTFRIARNPDADSTLPYLLWVPLVPIVFCENRQLAQEWAYRFLGAAAAFADEALLDLDRGF